MTHNDSRETIRTKVIVGGSRCFAVKHAMLCAEQPDFTSTHHTCTWWASKHGNKTEQSGRGKVVNQSNMQEPGSGVRVRESVSVCVRKCVLHVKDAC